MVDIMISEKERRNYRLSDSESQRRGILSYYIQRDQNAMEWHRKLEKLHMMTAKNQPTNSEKYRSDAMWVKGKYYGTRYWG